MTVERKDNCSQGSQGLLKNKAGKEIGLSSLLDCGLTREEFLRWYKIPLFASSLENQRNTLSFPRTFVAGGVVFDVLYSDVKSEKSLIEKLKLRALLMRLRLSQFVFPDLFKLQLRFGKPNAKLRCWAEQPQSND